MAKKVTKTNVTDEWFCGVIGGICKSYNINPFLPRLGFLLGILTTLGWLVFLYLLLAFFMPSEEV